MAFGRNGCDWRIVVRRRVYDDVLVSIPFCIRKARSDGANGLRGASSSRWSLHRNRNNLSEVSLVVDWDGCDQPGKSGKCIVPNFHRFLPENKLHNQLTLYVL